MANEGTIRIWYDSPLGEGDAGPNASRHGGGAGGVGSAVVAGGTSGGGATSIPGRGAHAQEFSPRARVLIDVLRELDPTVYLGTRNTDGTTDDDNIDGTIDGIFDLEELARVLAERLPGT